MVGDIMQVMSTLNYRLLSIDPSTKALGWAAFVYDSVGDAGMGGGKAKLVSSSVERVKEGGDEEPQYEWVHRIDTMVMLMRSRIVTAWKPLGKQEPKGNYPLKVLIELPDVFGSGKGVAAGNSGAILKLMGAVFSLRQAFLDDDSEGDFTSVELVPVRRWKGTVPKEITQKRIVRAWGWEGTDHNEADGVGIGDWWLRHVKKCTPVK